MFGMGFMEIFLIAIIAVIALGPDKLPTAMVEVAKFLKKFKSGVEDAKNTLDGELNVSELKNEVSAFKSQLEDTKASLTMEPSKMDLGLDKILDDEVEETKKEIEKEKVSFKKKKNQEVEKEDTKTSDKFKVNFDDDKKEDNV